MWHCSICKGMIKKTKIFFFVFSFPSWEARDLKIRILSLSKLRSKYVNLSHLKRDLVSTYITQHAVLQISLLILHFFVKFLLFTVVHC